MLRELPLGADRPYVLALAPERDLAGDYSFATRFSQRLGVSVRLTRDGAVVAEAEGGSRSMTCAVRLALRAPRRAARQARHRAPGARSPARLPPVVSGALIGAHKAELYTRALIGDIVHKRHDLADPGWLVRVGLYLELLTCLGVIEAVKDEVATC